MASVGFCPQETDTYELEIIVLQPMYVKYLPQAKRQPEIDIAHRKRDERLFVIDIELGVSYWNGGMRGKHDG